MKLIFQVLPDGEFASSCFIVHILECTIKHLSCFIEWSLVNLADNNTSRRTCSLYLCSMSVAQFLVTKTLKKKHAQINHSLLTNSQTQPKTWQRALSAMVARVWCPFIILGYFSVGSMVRSRKQNSFTFIFITGMNHATISS